MPKPKMDTLKTTNTLLLIVVVPLVFYLLNILSFIFVPLVAAMFISLLFLPMLRWFAKKHVNKFVSIGAVLLTIIIGFALAVQLIKLSSHEIMSAEGEYFEKAQAKLDVLIVSVHDFTGIDLMSQEEIMSFLLQKDQLMKSFMPTLDFITHFLTMLLMTIFFVVLLLAESINIQQFLNSTILRQRYASIKIFMKIERDLITFIKVKFLISFGTGLAVSLLCLFFDVSFPIFWGILTFGLNFIQMIGSIISVVLITMFTFVELDPNSIWMIFVLCAIGIQVLFGSIMEPVFMGHSFSINIVTILVMLMLWGFIWGILGMVMAVPITVFIKILMEQFPNTRVIAFLMSAGTAKQPIIEELESLVSKTVVE